MRSAHKLLTVTKVVVAALVLALLPGRAVSGVQASTGPSFEERQTRAMEDIARTLKRMEARCK